jgi:hypothetical protein
MIEPDLVVVDVSGEEKLKLKADCVPPVNANVVKPELDSKKAPDEAWVARTLQLPTP